MELATALWYLSNSLRLQTREMICRAVFSCTSSSCKKSQEINCNWTNLKFVWLVPFLSSPTAWSHKSLETYRLLSSYFPELWHLIAENWKANDNKIASNQIDSITFTMSSRTSVTSLLHMNAFFSANVIAVSFEMGESCSSSLGMLKKKRNEDLQFKSMHKVSCCEIPRYSCFKSS